MNVEWTTRTTDDVTLVEVIVTNDGPPRRVRISNELDGPVWPPRMQGIPAAGWDEHGFVGKVEDRRALGYSTPAPPVEPPVSVEWLETIISEEQHSGGHSAVPTVPTVPEPTPNNVYRTLSDPRPPRDAVPVTIEPTIDQKTTIQNNKKIELKKSVTGHESIAPATRNGSELVEGYERAQPDIGSIHHPAVESLFRTIEQRIDDGEMLTEVETLPDATWAVETMGGLTAVVDLMTALDTDCETLQAIEERAAQLRERAETVDVPVDTLERLA